MRLQTMPLSSAALACALALMWPHAGRAQPRGDDPSGAPRDSLASASGLIVLGGKLGGIGSRGGVDSFARGGIELGSVLPSLGRGLGALLQLEYSGLTSAASVDEWSARERVLSGGYRWQLLQKELVLQPTFLYRITSLFDSITPFVGVGLRVYLLESIIMSRAEDQTVEQSTERSTELGGGLPIGAEFALGPGALTGEVMLEWGPLKHLITGATYRGGVSACAGYRVLR